MSKTNWKRPFGPPNVWKIVEVEEKTNDRTSTRSRLSIQDIPEDRYEEALDHMCEYFLADEVTCKCLKIKEDQHSVEAARVFWDYLLKQGMSIGVFELNSKGELGELVGMNVLLVPTDENEKKIEEIIMVNSKVTRMGKVFKTVQQVSAKLDIRKTYGVDKYLTAMGLSVKPTHRGRKLGVRLLEARKDIGDKYGIAVTSTIFMGPSSQIQAERAGFETVLTLKYVDFVDADGQPLFPNIEAEEMKLMVMKL